MSNAITKAWENTSVGEVSERILGGGTPSKSNLAFFKGNIPFMTVKDMKSFVLGSTIDHISEIAIQQSSTQTIPANTPIIATRMSLGKIVHAEFDVAINQDLKAIFLSPCVNKDYFKYWYRSAGNLIESLGAGTTVKGINLLQLKALKIPLPPLAEQKEIADRLDTLLEQVDRLKTRLDAIPNILKRFRQSVLSAAVSGKLTEDWRRTPELHNWKEGNLGNFIKKPSYGTSSKSAKEGKVPVLRMGNLQGGKLDWSALVYSSDPEEIKKYRLEPGDVLFNRTNSPELVGKTSIFRGEREAIYAGYLIRIKCLESLNSEFLNYHLNSPIAKDYCISVKSDGVSQSNINAQKLSAYPINCPPIEEQNEIVNRVEKLFTFADSIEAKVKAAQTRANNLTQSILAKAFRGELTADWRATNLDLITGENSAEALLARIQVEREALKQTKKPKRKKAAKKKRKQPTQPSSDTNDQQLSFL